MPFYVEDPFVTDRRATRTLVSMIFLAAAVVAIVVVLLAGMLEAHAATAHFCTLRKIGGSWVKVCR